MTNLVGAPVEIAVIEFPGSRFDGEIIPALAELVDDRVVTIIDLCLVTKEADGSVMALEISDLSDEDAAAFEQLDGEVTGLLSAEDIEQVGATLSLGSSAVLVVWENTWAGRLTEAVLGAGGRLVAHDRLDAETVRTALAQDR